MKMKLLSIMAVMLCSSPLACMQQDDEEAFYFEPSLFKEEEVCYFEPSLFNRPKYQDEIRADFLVYHDKYAVSKFHQYPDNDIFDLKERVYDTIFLYNQFAKTLPDNLKPETFKTVLRKSVERNTRLCKNQPIVIKMHLMACGEALGALTKLFMLKSLAEEYPVDVNLRIYPGTFKSSRSRQHLGIFNEFLLHDSVACNAPEYVAFLLEHNACIDEKNDDGLTPLEVVKNKIALMRTENDFDKKNLESYKRIEELLLNAKK